MKFALRCLLALVLFSPALSFANSSVDFTNSGGNLVGSNGGLLLASSLIAVHFNNTLDTGALGTLSFDTGVLTSGSLGGGGTFAAGGQFIITGDGADGIHNGVIFNGVFSGPVTWTLVTLANGTHNYTLTGALQGTWWTGAPVFGATVQLTINTGTQFYNGSTLLSSGNTNVTGVGLRITNTPEPGTLTMLGTGLLGMGLTLRRKLRKV